jgi:hypothetical protein
MPWSAGTYTRSNGANGWQLDAAANIGIEAGLHDTADTDLATGINACLNKNGQNSPTANISMGGFKFTNVATATASTEFATLGQLESAVQLGAWTSYATTHTGFSVDPTYNMYYKKDGRTVTIVYSCSVDGTSNADNYLLSLPFVSRNIPGMKWWCACPSAVDGGGRTPLAVANLSANSATLELLRNSYGAVWDTTLGKSANFTFIYEAAS